MKGMELSASEAAREVGKSVQTITRAIGRGALSAKRTEQGGYLIDTSELFRVYPRRSVEPSATPSMEGDATPEKVNATGALETEIKMLREMLEREQDTVADLRTRLNAEAEERRKLTAMLTYKPEPSAPEPAATGVGVSASGQGKAVGGFWSRLWGKTASNA